MTAANFERARELTGVSEGGWSDRPLSQDPGGPTMKGVTLKTYTAWRLSKGLPKPSKDDLRNITDAEVSAIFREGYWTPARCDDLPAGLDYAVFDCAINSGPGRAVRVLQEVVGAAVDGRIGPKTLAAVHAASLDSDATAELIDRYQDARLAFLKGLANWSANPGWAVRVERVRREAKAMCNPAKEKV